MVWVWRKEHVVEDTPQRWCLSGRRVLSAAYYIARRLLWDLDCPLWVSRGPPIGHPFTLTIAYQLPRTILSSAG